MIKRFMACLIALALAIVSPLAAVSPVAAAEVSDRPIITEGTRGAGVTRLQEELKELGFFESEPDGIYGEGTSNAVAAYAAARGITTIGGVNMAMIQALYADMAPGTLDEGSKGTAVYAVQRLLFTTGFLDGEPDGVFGRNTKKGALAYMNFAAESAVDFMQQRQDAREAAFSAIEFEDMPAIMDAPLINAQTIPTDGAVTEDWFAFMVSGSAVYGNPVREGDTGSDARRVQKRLKALKYLATGIDGAYGANTALAMRYFQQRNGLPETGECDVDTQLVLFSDAAMASDQYVSPYMAYVSTKLNKVRIMAWTGSGYTKEVKMFTCTTGAKATPTLKGTHQAVGPVSEWYYMQDSVIWVRYAFQIKGNYFFHSVLFKNKGDKKPTAASLRNLGHNASHGCVRLAVKDAKWIYENCTPGMTVVIK